MTDISAQSARRFTRAERLLLLLIPAVYVLLLGHFRTFNIDNPWYAAYTYSWWNGNSPVDPLMLRTFPDGMGGVEAFGKLAAGLQGIVMNAFGWRILHFEVLSLLFVSASLFFFADTARRMGRSREFVLAYTTIVGLSEQFLFAAEQARYEYLTLLLFALALWFGTRRQYAIAALLAALCMEIQPAGCLPFVATVVFLLRMEDATTGSHKRFVYIAAGSFLASAIYLTLHPHIFQTLQRAIHSSHHPMKGTPGGFLVGYFLESRRHLPELMILGAAAVVAARRRAHIFRDWAGIAFGLAILLSVLMRWDNPRYVALLMPFVAWFLVDAFSEQHWKWIAAGTAILFLPQYAYRAAVSLRHPDFTSAEQNQVAAAINRAAVRLGKQSEEVRVRGNHSLWFAHPENFTALDRRTMLPGKPTAADVVLCFEQKLDPVLQQRSSEVRCADLEDLPHPFQTLSIHGVPLHIVLTADTNVRLN